MNEVTLPSRHQIRNLGPSGLRPSTSSLGHRGIKSLQVSEEVAIFLKLEYQWGHEPATSDFPRNIFSKQAVLTTAPGPPPCSRPIDSCLSIAIIVVIMTHL